MPQKLFTKSAFKQALNCPAAMYYYRNSDLYANQQLDDEFLESLAEGGFQVGEAAKVYYGIPEKDTIEALGYEEALAETRRMFAAPRARIAEAAFRYGNCFVRADIIVKDGKEVKLIEVKARSWDPNSDSFTNPKKPDTVMSDILPYVYDVAFQKWVVTNALHEQYPGEKYKVKAFLMMADKSKEAPLDGINQMFRIVTENGRKAAKRSSDAFQLAGTDPVVVAFDVDELCDRIIAGATGEQVKMFGKGKSFLDFVQEMSEAYCNNERLWAEISTKCYKCPFTKSPGDNSNLKDGYHECWIHALDWTEEDFERPLLSDLNGIKTSFFKRKEFHLEDIVPSPGYSIDDSHGIEAKDRNLLIAGLLTGKKAITDLYHNLHGDTYLNKDYLRAQMDTWVFPLHMIDFETSAVALPFYKGMRPYESVAFQFSHHIIRKTADGYSIEHAGQFINVEKGHFPNFDFIRALKSDLEKDGGSIFRYSHHENTILNHIADQLGFSDEPDADELQDFIHSITHFSGLPDTGGPRDMIDLCEIVKKAFYHPSMKGSNSIKYVLPAILNTSKFLQEKYSKAIYGSEIKSLNIPADSPIALISFAEDGKTVVNPYNLLPPVAEYMDLSEEEAEIIGEAADSKIANGGAALTAYSLLQFSDDVKADALAKALLRYCELDTMAMVFLWEYFYNEVYN